MSADVWARRGLMLLAAAALLPLGWNEWSRLGERRARSAEVERHRSAGVAALEAGDAERAVIALQRARDLDATHPEVLSALVRAQAHLVMERPEVLTAQSAPSLGHELALAVAEKRPRDPAIHQVALGNVAAWQGDTAAAEAAYEAALELEPERVAAHHYLGRLRLGQDRAAEAETHLLKAVELAGPTGHAERVSLGRALLAQEKHARAAEVLRKAAELKADAESLRLLGRAELAAERWEAAMAAFEKALAAGAKGAVLDDLGYAAYRAGRLDEARAHLERAAQAGGNVETLYNLGVVYQGLERHAEAAQLFERVVANKAGLAEAHVNLLNALLKARELGATRKAAQRYLKLSERHASLEAKKAEVTALLAQLDKMKPPAPGLAAPPEEKPAP